MNNIININKMMVEHFFGPITSVVSLASIIVYFNFTARQKKSLPAWLHHSRAQPSKFLGHLVSYPFLPSSRLLNSPILTPAAFHHPKLIITCLNLPSRLSSSSPTFPLSICLPVCLLFFTISWSWVRIWFQ